MDEKTLSEVNEGRHAVLCAQWMSPIFAASEAAIIANLKNAYRSGEYTESVLASGVAGLCVLEDLKQRVHSIARRGESASKRMENHDAE